MITVEFKTTKATCQGLGSLHYSMSKTLLKQPSGILSVTILNHIDVLSDYVIVHSNYTAFLTLCSVAEYCLPLR